MNNVRKDMEEILKNILREFTIREREKYKLTQQTMANALVMDLRSYAYIESGDSLAGTLTTILILLHTPERDRLLARIDADLNNYAEKTFGGVHIGITLLK